MNYDATTKKDNFCNKHQKYCKPNTGSWILRENGWECSEINISYPEFVPQRIHDDRRKYLKSQIQSHRGGELSKEFVDLYPEKVKAMKKAGVITNKEIKGAKKVWKDLPGIDHVAKTE